MAMPQKKEAGTRVPPGADPGVPPEESTRFPRLEDSRARYVANLERSRREGLFLDSIEERILEEHGDCWVAVADEEVVAVADTEEELHALLDAADALPGRAVRRRLQRHPEPVGSHIPPGADPGVPPEVFAELMANRPTKEQQAEWLDSLIQSGRDGLYLTSIKDRILAEHGDCWIAAYMGEVVAIADTSKGLFEQTEERGIPRGKAVWRRFQKHPPHMIPGLRRWL